MTDADILEIRARLTLAFPVDDVSPSEWYGCYDCGALHPSVADRLHWQREVVRHDVPALLAEVERVRAEVIKAAALLTQYPPAQLAESFRKVAEALEALPVESAVRTAGHGGAGEASNL